MAHPLHKNSAPVIYINDGKLSPLERCDSAAESRAHVQCAPFNSERQRNIKDVHSNDYSW